MNNAVFWITMKNVRKPRDIKLLTTERRKYYLVSEPHFHATKFFTGSLLALEIKKTEILMNKLSSLNFQLELSKILMDIWVNICVNINEFWYDYVKLKNGKKVKYRNFNVYIKTDYIYKDIAEDVETTFDTSNYE